LGCRQPQRIRRSPQEDSLDGIFDDVAHEEIQEVDGLVEDIAEEIRDLSNMKVSQSSYYLTPVFRYGLYACIPA
jgi:hypothetical protein